MHKFNALMIYYFIRYYLENDAQLNPFNRPAVQAMKKSLEQFAQRQNIPLDTFSAKLKARNNRTVCKTLHKGGLIVPYDRKTTVGYRPISESDGKFYIRKMFYFPSK